MRLKRPIGEVEMKVLAETPTARLIGPRSVEVNGFYFTLNARDIPRVRWYAK